MKLLKVVKHYKKRLEKQFTQQIGRKQFNFSCDKRLITRLKVLANALEVPIYPLVEHIIELGMSEVLVKLEDEALKEKLQRHLLQEHLLVKELKPMDEEVSERALRITNALKLLKLIELKGKTPNMITHEIDRLL